ncbi:WD40 repeat-like protein [Sistotremastrum suecicum HHB10207 ss-3]|uniref:WD40 repeat-like protein n=1 Tax=Sistotremastrum suecicum HHB10207 ss-3 TaxID=1314776 RepID=A0A165YCP6_9AGAM|nr:WD40 repeat-like protein [Sistotremastrum suecicum HHB10207 ss-3]
MAEISRLKEDSMDVKVARTSLNFQSLHTLPQKRDVMSLALSPDARHLAVHSTDETLTVWSVRTGEIVLALGDSGGGAVSTYRWAQPYGGPFGFGLVCGFRGGILEVVEMRETERPTISTNRQRIQAHDGDVLELSVDQTHTLVCSVGHGVLKLWKIQNNWVMCILDQVSIYSSTEIAYNNPIFWNGAVYLPSGAKLISWKISDWKLLYDRDLQLPHPASSGEVSDDEQWLLLHHRTEGTYLYSLPQFSCVRTVFAAKHARQTVTFARGSRSILYGDDSGSIRFLPLPKLFQFGSLSHHKNGSVAAAAVTVGLTSFVASGTSASLPGDEPTVRIWTDSVSFASKLRSQPSSKQGFSRRFRSIIQITLVLWALKVSYDLGRLVGVEQTTATFDYPSHVILVLWQSAQLCHNYLNQLIHWYYMFRRLYA